jgi:hypothetical protein
MTWITPTAFWDEILVMFCWEGGPTDSSKSFFSSGESAFGRGGGEGSLFGLNNVVVHAVMLVSEAIAAILAVEGIDKVCSGSLGIGLNGNGVLHRSWQRMKAWKLVDQ